jgi:hypothetical protein
MARDLRINIIDHDLLTSASGLIGMRRSDQMAVVLSSDANEDAVREFFRVNWAIELDHNVINAMIEKRLGLTTLSVRTQLCSEVRTHPLVKEAADLKQLRDTLSCDVAKDEPFAPKDRGRPR